MRFFTRSELETEFERRIEKETDMFFERERRACNRGTVRPSHDAYNRKIQKIIAWHIRMIQTFEIDRPGGCNLRRARKADNARYNRRVLSHKHISDSANM